MSNRGPKNRGHPEMGSKNAKGRLPAALIRAVLLSAFAATALAQTYSQGAKRDPFIDLRATRKTEAPALLQPPPFSQRPPGLSGLLISEVSVQGTAANDKTRLVILKGTDGFTYIAREGIRLFDGFVEAINSDGVVFVREVFDTTGKKTSSRVTKQFYIETR